MYLVDLHLQDQLARKNKDPYSLSSFGSKSQLRTTPTLHPVLGRQEVKVGCDGITLSSRRNRSVDHLHRLSNFKNKRCASCDCWNISQQLDRS